MISNVLISGAGIAGPALAFWLARAGIRTTIVERASSIPTGGQQIDVRGAALEVVRRMDLEDTVRSKTTKEQGLAFVDEAGTVRASFGVDANKKTSIICDIEILRGDLGKVLHEATEDTTEYIFGDHITQLEQSEDSVNVHFALGAPKVFDLVIAADGMRSATRSLAFDEKDVLHPVHPLGQYICYFTIPSKKDDGTWAKSYNAPGRRHVLTRPDHAGSLRSYLSVMSPMAADYHALNIAGQKKLMRDVFTGAGWETSRVLDGMDDAKDFYMQEIAQVKMTHLSKGRVALLGDAGYCPSPISGMGTSLAIVGAYILAGEIVKHREDPKTAFEGYEAEMRERVKKAQKLPPGAPAIANPQTAWGIWFLLAVLSLVSKTGIVSWFSGGTSKDAELPVYDFAEPKL